MKEFPLIPFLTDDFSPQGKGIDYLGMRNVNLTYLEAELVPGINNVTRDVGTYILGAWLVWKFVDLCKSDPNRYTRDNFLHFSQAVELAMAHATRDGSPINQTYRLPRTRIGKNQKIDFSKPFSFKNMARGSSATIFYAAQYGPSLKWVGLTRDAKIKDGSKSAGFQMPNNSPETELICREVDQRLRTSPYYDKLMQAGATKLDESEIDHLGQTGLCPGAYIHPQGDFKKALESKFLPPESARSTTAQLVLRSLQLLGAQPEDTLRRCWYTGKTPDNAPLVFSESFVDEQARKWGIFYSRQLLRYALESLLCCLERGILRGLRSIDEVVDEYMLEWMEAAADEVPQTFRSLLHLTCQKAGVTATADLSATWCDQIGPAHAQFEFAEFKDCPEMFRNVMTHLAGWWLRLKGRAELYGLLDTLPHETGRVPMGEFHQWLEERMDTDFITLCRDLLAEFVYSQHLRIGMSRLGADGTRLRFSLGDHGIEQTANLGNFGSASPPLMGDRLEALVNLMEDLGYLVRSGNKVSVLVSDC